MKIESMKIEFTVERADRDVGIMSDGFTASAENETLYCSLVDVESGVCEWVDSDDDGEKWAAGPDYGHLVEAALVAWARAYCERLA